MTKEEFLKLAISGCKFKYISYDHKKAMIEYNSNPKYQGERKWIKNPDCWSVPFDLKEKFMVERIGKLRRINFNPNGDISKIFIGNKREKVFYLHDFGVKFFTHEI